MKKTEKPDEGIRDEKGHWRPSQPCTYAPLFQLPWRPLEVLKWLFRWGGYLWPRHLILGLLAAATWYFLQPDLSVTRTLSFGWIGYMLIRNLILITVVSSFYHLTLYVWKLQGTKGKYHPEGMARNSKKYLFSDQVKDNIFYSIVSGVPIWTAWEVFYVWAAANGRVPLITFSSNPVWFVALFLLVPLWRETHFYFVHRLLHWKPLLKAFHSTHHRNPNPGPWSGMSMHPVEHLLYISCAAIHFVVPSHPIHFLFNTQHAALTPAQGHTGYHGPLFKGVWPAGDYFHYLHHKYVSCNFGIANIPWDKWLGRYYDGEGPYKTKQD